MNSCVLRLVALALVLVLGPGPVAGEPVLIDGDSGRPADLVATKTGWALAALGAGGISLYRLDTDGAPLGDPVALGTLGLDRPSRAALETTPKGFLVTAYSQPFFPIRAQGFDEGGFPLGPPRDAVAAGDLLAIDLAPGSSGAILIYAKAEIFYFFVLAQPLDPFGAPSGDSSLLTVRREAEAGGFIQGVRVTPRRGGLLAGWAELGLKSVLRPMKNDGSPSGPALRGPGAADFPQWALPVASDGHEALISVVGLGDTDVVLNRRGGDGLGGPVALAASGAREGYSTGYHPLAAAGRGDGFGLAYRVLEANRVGVRFSEFGFDGAPRGATLDLEADLGLEVGTGPFLLGYDEASGRFVLVASGEGPQGPGLYLVWIDASS